MKKVILTLTALFFTLLSFSQGIAVQGIARDANNTARVNTLLTLQFKVYYRDGATEVSIYDRSSNVTTDFFGVFSHVINIEEEMEEEVVVTEFGNQELWLRISEGSTAISDSEFNRVPYAYAASNGVPTGSIMPFIGTTAPSGWLLCDGGTIEAVPHTVALRNLLESNNTPDLQGMFLRGAGRSPLSTATVVKEGPELMSTQQDSNKLHTHTKGSLASAPGGDHNHHTEVILPGGAKTMYNKMTRASGDTPNKWQNTIWTEGNTSYVSSTYVAGRLDLENNVIQRNSGNHPHTITGITGAISIDESLPDIIDNESRPVNYGVNYIIKL